MGRCRAKRRGFHADVPEVLAKQKKIMDGVQYKRGVDRYGPNQHKTIQEELVEEVNKIAAQIPNAKVIQPPDVKSFKRAEQKVNGQYEGAWPRIKDLNRCTLVVAKESDLENAWRRVCDHFKLVRRSSRLQFLSEKAHKITNRQSLWLFRFHRFRPDRRPQRHEGRDPDQLSAHDVRETDEGTLPSSAALRYQLAACAGSCGTPRPTS